MKLFWGYSLASPFEIAFPVLMFVVCVNLHDLNSSIKHIFFIQI